jgi:putative ABC transport system permease protein
LRAALVVAAALRESRGARGRLVFFVLCLALGVAAITGVAALVASVEHALQAQSRELLGADLSIDGRRPVPGELDRFFPGAQRTDVREMTTLAAANGKSRLVELKAVGCSFPYYGGIELDPPGELAELLTPERCAVAPELMRELGLATGDRLSIGGRDFQVAAAVLEEPGRLDVAFTLGPRVFLGLEGLASTELEGFGSRVRYRALYRLPEELDDKQLDALRRRIRAQVPDATYFRIESHRDAQPTVRRSLERVERYLGLVALLSLVHGGTGVAQIVRAWLAARKHGVAGMRV